jgi:hypothetical protein
MANGETFNLCEFAKKTDPKAAGRLFPDKSDEVRRDQIVAIELFPDRAILLGEVNGGTDGGHQHQIAGIARDAD